jgi:protein-disulfide isomerase
MNIKRFIFWACFIIVLALIVWGLAVAMNKPVVDALGTAPDVSLTDNVTSTSTLPVTLIEYSDFQCPACGAYYPIVERLVAEASTTMRLVYRHFPLSQHLNAELAARASEAAARQGKFWDMHRLLFENQNVWNIYSDAAARAEFARYASQIGLDMALYNADIDSQMVIDRIKGDQNGGVKIGINSTPTFFINGKVISNPQSYEEFKALIDSAAQTSTP